ncbi:response regulator transcription factor [Microbacterium sp. STN6]|uniref:response regulator n=1 Tax=Microbacterium sp. STN6 TaxID=2995588 RepID=UPI002260A31C|nr:response regulator transcription factor [Microbacterium sp. STN6]MCX7522922.1 response regulator transcription factor [Microbacterium sp. STN6]
MSGVAAAPVRVVLVDDQELVRAGFRTILETQADIEVVGEASDGAAGVTEVRRLAPDVVCMDVQMPGVDGLEATRRLTADPAVASAVLMLTTFDREDYLFEALAAGASGFLLKNASPERLIEAVRILARGDGLLSPEVTRRVIERAAAERGPGRGVEVRGDEVRGVGAHAADGGGHGVGGAAAASPLTEREREVLDLLARGLSNAEIAARLFLGEATVKTHVSKILMKLQLRDRVHAVVFAYENGLARPGTER